MAPKNKKSIWSRYGILLLITLFPLWFVNWFSPWMGFFSSATASVTTYLKEPFHYVAYFMRCDDSPDYYGFTRRYVPIAFKNGGCVFDFSKKEWTEKFFREIGSAGVNLTHLEISNKFGVTYANSPGNLPFDLTFNTAVPPEDLFSLADKYGVDILLRVDPPGLNGASFFDLETAKTIVAETYDLFKHHSSLKGYILPLETDINIPVQAVLDMAQTIKAMDPKLWIMDYPSNPKSPYIQERIREHSLFPEVDFENVQFPIGNKYLGGPFKNTHGLTRYLLGLANCPKIIAHTHFMDAYGGLCVPPDRAYEISQGVLLTATPFGCSWWGMIQDAWGVGWRDGLDAQWRRLKWYEGILSVQRFEPYYSHARDQSEVGILIPWYPSFNSTALVENVMRPLAESRMTVSFFNSAKQMPDNLKVILAPVTRGLSDAQISLLQEALSRGITVIFLNPDKDPWRKVSKPKGWDYSNANRFNPLFLSMIGMDEAAWIKGITQDTVLDKAPGKIILLADTMYSVQPRLAAKAGEQYDPRIKIGNLPNSFLVEHYFKSNQFSENELIMLLASSKDEPAANVAVNFRPSRHYSWAYLLVDDRISRIPLAPGQDVHQINIPNINSYACLILADRTYPFLAPELKVKTINPGETFNLSLKLINGDSQQTLQGALEVAAPPGWNVSPSPQEVALQPNEEKEMQITVQAPAALEDLPYFIGWNFLGLSQRTMILAPNGTARKISDLTEAEFLPQKLAWAEFCPPYAAATFFADADGDGYGDPNNTVKKCASYAPEGYAANGEDCNDADPQEHPGQIWFLESSGYANTETRTVSCSRPGPAYKTSPELLGIIYEDGESGQTAGWSIVDKEPSSPVTPKIKNVADGGGRVIQLAGNGTANGYQLVDKNGEPWNNQNHFVLTWRLKSLKDFAVYAQIETTAGPRYLQYTPTDTDNLGAGVYVHHGVGKNSINGQWHTFFRDLSADLKGGQPDNHLLAVNKLIFRGNCKLDDVALRRNLPSVLEDAEDLAAGRWSVYDDSPPGAAIANVFDEDRQSRVIEFSGDGANNGYLLKNRDQAAWANGNRRIEWSMKYSQKFSVYVDVATTAGRRYLLYQPVNINKLGTGTYVHHGLGAAAKSGVWRTFMRDLQADLSEAQPGTTILGVNRFLIRGSGRGDDIRLR
ncbi:MAG: hypothetical protein C4567_07405 [Deltaproteobacteria bacterium]|nr:MAG: hypothetical protein C4567_07405 [Deltaproteobacteria bacterium]